MIVRFLSLPAGVAVLLSAASAIAQSGVPLVPPAAAQPPESTDPVEALGRYLRVLALFPRNLDALTGAARSSLAIGDANAAISFYARAQEIAPQDGRIKAGLASALVQMEQPKTALKLFDQAVSLGVPEAEVASDRGLARDLRGDTRRAQADYALALRTRRDDETVRRLAVSQAIGGDRAAAMATLDPLLRRQDRAAWRVRAFVLALTGDREGAEQGARGAMPGPQAQALMPFFARLAGLKPGEKAAAVHLGQFPSDGHSGDNPELFARADNAASPTPPGPRSDVPLIPSGTALGASVPSDQLAALSRAPRRRPGMLEPVPQGAVVPPSATLPPAAAVVQTAAPKAPALPPRSAPSSAVLTAVAPPVAPVSHATPASSSPPVLVQVPSGFAAVPPASLSPVLVVTTVAPAPATPVARPVATDGAAIRATEIPPSTAAGAGLGAPIVETRFGPALAASTAPVEPPVTLAAAEPAPPVPPPQKPEAAEPKPALGEAPAAREHPVRVSGHGKDQPAAADVEPARRAAKGKSADADPEPASRKTKSSGKDARSAKADAARDKLAARDEHRKDADQRDAGKQEVGKKDGKNAKSRDAKAKEAAADKTSTDKADAARSTGERYWVQVASGANKDDLGRAWARTKTRAPKLLDGRDTYTSPWKASNRLLVGPFRTDEEAQGFVNTLAKSGMVGMQFTSRGKTKVERLSGN